MAARTPCSRRPCRGCRSAGLVRVGHRRSSGRCGVFAGEVKARTRSDPRLRELEEAIAQADEADRARLRTRWYGLYQSVYAKNLGQVADQFDGIHTVERAQQVGSIHRIITPARLRPYLIEAVERGVEKASPAMAAGASWRCSVALGA